MALATLCEDVGQSRRLKAQTVDCVNHESHLNNCLTLFPPFVAPEAIKELVFWNFSLSGGFHDFLTWRPFISFTPCSLLSIGLQAWLHECKVQECINFHSILLPVESKHGPYGDHLHPHQHGFVDVRMAIYDNMLSEVTMMTCHRLPRSLLDAPTTSHFRIPRVCVKLFSKEKIRPTILGLSSPYM